MPRLAANLTMMFTEFAFPDRFAAAADAGFTAVEYLFPYDHEAQAVRGWLDAAGLSQALFNMPPGDWTAGERGLAALPGRETEFRQSVGLAIDYGKVIGTPLLHMMAGIADRSDAAAVARYRDAVAFAADATAEADIGLVLEPINPRDMPGYFLNDFRWTTDLIADLGHANVKLQFDIYHRQVLHGDVTKALEALMPVIGHVQIAAVPFRHEPGTGELDDGRILRALDALGYAGYVGCEYRPANGTLEGLGWMQAL